MSLDEALQYIHEHGYPLIFANELQVDIWTSGRRVPLALRRAIYANRETLAAMMGEGARAVCPNPLHKRGRGRRICKTCAQLAPFIHFSELHAHSRKLRTAA